MKCPHCRQNFHDTEKTRFIGEDSSGSWGTITRNCPACNQIVIEIFSGEYVRTKNLFTSFRDRKLVYPKGTVRPPCPTEVPVDIAEDYTEACLVLSDSPKASAALGRRALQNLLRDAASVTKSDLVKEIQEVLDSGKLPTHIAENIDAIRNIGNFSAHPIKSQSTGAILPVEPHEAEWTLEVLEQLFDFYYLQPAVAKRKRDELNNKLAAAGKPPMK